MYSEMETDMSRVDSGHEPDWDTAVDLQLAPAAIIHALFWSAGSVHTGWESCVQHDLVVFEISAIDDHSDNHCRLAEQEYVEDPSEEVTWHDWSVELKLGHVYISAHWRARMDDSPAEWDWCADEAEKAFSAAAVLVGKRVRRGLAVESEPNSARAPRTHH